MLQARFLLLAVRESKRGLSLSKVLDSCESFEIEGKVGLVKVESDVETDAGTFSTIELDSK